MYTVDMFAYMTIDDDAQQYSDVKKRASNVLLRMEDTRFSIFRASNHHSNY